MRMPSNDTINAKFFTTKNPLHSDMQYAVGEGRLFPRQWFTYKDIYAFGHGSIQYKFCAVVMPYKRQYVPFVWHEDYDKAEWVRVGYPMSLEEAKAVCLMRDAMKNAVPLIDQSKEQVE